jgi:uncharacterized protein (TIGR03435 family)
MDPGRITCTNTPLKRLILAAHDLKDYQLIGPSWLDTERFDITATMAKDSTSDEVLKMFQNMLAERFQLTMHSETRELPVYALTIAKTGHKLKEVEFGRSSTSMNHGKMEAHGVPPANLAAMLSRLIDRPVLDETNLKGFFDFNLEWTPDETGAAARPAEPGTFIDSAVGPNLAVALQQQLGLRLESRKAPIEVLVVDRVSKTATEN